METAFIEEEIKYDGSQLTSHFAYRKRGLLGTSCVAFAGPCQVSLEKMVDLEDVRQGAAIYSPAMLHFIWEDFSLDLEAAVLWQRMMVAQLAEILVYAGVQGLRRRGDDLFVGERKLTVSIATRSAVSSLIHLGINVGSEGAPVAAIGLSELGIDALKLGRDCLEKFQREYLEVQRARCKVRAVP